MSDQENMIDDVELPEASEDQIEEAKGHDPESAEKDSVDSVDKAGDATKQAAAPNGQSVRHPQHSNADDFQRRPES